MEASLRLLMNEAMALAPQNIISAGLDDLLALVGLPSRRKSAVELSSAAEEILKGITSVLDGLVLRAVASQDQQEFRAARTEVFPNYANAVISLAKLANIIVPEHVMDRVVGETFSEFEAEFREHGLERFGAPTKEQAMFTVWTLRRTSRLISKISNSARIPKGRMEQDRELASNFTFYTVWTQFHLDCLLAAIRFNKPIQLDVLPEIIDGLRGAVNAYGYARQGLRLRAAETESPLTPYQWDEEDQDLLDSSMRDMETQVLDD
jgi:hypothetical protein